jgi:hydroxymethylpyrimidine pyrophosphatase-like HAD family hydrolase
MIRLVATDLDGTLWDRTVTVRPDVRAAIDELQRQGITVLAATGRRPRSARSALADNDLSLPAVCLDGTFGEDFVLGRRFHESLFDAPTALAVLELFVAHDVGPNVFVDHHEVDVLLAAMPTHRPERAESLLDWARIGPLHESVPEHRVAAFTVIGGEYDRLAPLAAAVTAAGLARATLTSDSLYGGTSLSVIPAPASKWAGVAAFAAAHGIEPSEVLGVGDAANDLELLEGAGCAVAVRSGAPEVVAVADELIDPPGDGGWAAIVGLCAERA